MCIHKTTDGICAKLSDGAAIPFDRLIEAAELLKAKDEGLVVEL